MNSQPSQANPAIDATAGKSAPRHLVIRASAGSGKTFQLVVRYLQTLLAGVPAERILASTFTRKAAGEILERLLGRLAVAARRPDQLQQLAADLGEPDFDRDDSLRLLRSLTRELHRLQVGTLDSFFSRLAKSYTLELGLPPGWDVVEELEDAGLRRQALGVVLQEGSVTDTRKLANLLSKGDAARSVTRQIAETIESHYGIFQQTDREAWHQYPELIPLSSEVLSQTIEELRVVPLPDHKSVQKQRLNDLDAAEREDWLTFVTTGIAAVIASGKTTYYRKTIEDPAATVYQTLSRHARAIVIRERAARTAATYELLVRFDAAYRRLKREARRLRFEDVTLALDRAFGEQPVQQLTYRLDGDVSHLLLDEFQDTSRSQWAVLRPFAERIADEPEGTSLFCVGDVKQAIYGWRGGVAEIFDAVQNELPNMTTESLVKSWRSSPVVIESVNELFAGISRHENLKDDEPAIRSWCDRFETHQTARTLPGRVSVETPEESDAPDAEKPVEKVLPAAVRLIEKIVRQAPDAEAAVLLRRNVSIAAVIHGLQALGIDASEEGGNPLTDSAAVQLLLSLATLADHPGDTIARFHLASSPLSEAVGFTRFDDDQAAGRLAADVRRRLDDDGYGPTVESWTRSLSPFVSPRDRGRLDQLVELAYRYESQATLRPSRFVRFVETTRIDAPSPAKVRVMSIHQAKGLEFDVVVLPLVEHALVARPPSYVAGGPSPAARPDLVFDYPAAKVRPLLPERFQQAYRQTRAAQVSEELCSLYVAVTRARHALHVIVPACPKTGASLPKNSAGLVRAALCDGAAAPPSEILYERGDRDWAAHHQWSPPDPAGTEASAPPSTPCVRLAEMTDGRSRGLRRVAPSQAGSEERVRLAQLVQGPRSAALTRGTLIHAWFEQIRWLEDGLPDEDALLAVGRRLGLSQDEARESLLDFQAMIAGPAVASLLSEERYLAEAHMLYGDAVRERLLAEPADVEVHPELPVVARISGELLNGTIDRLVLLRQGGQVVAADVIDFKTDVVGAGGAADMPRTDHYRRQLHAYTAAIGRIHHLPAQAVVARLVFVTSGEFVSLD